MYEWCDTAGSVLRECETEEEAMDLFSRFSVRGDYVWDSVNRVVLIANVEKLVEEL